MRRVCGVAGIGKIDLEKMGIAPTALAPSTAHRGPRGRWTIAILSACILFYVINNVIWLLNDASSPSYDRAAHAGFALEYLRLFEAPTRLSLTKLLAVTQYWPPFFHVCSVPFTLTLGFSVASVAATNLLFVLITVFSLYRIGRRLFDPWVGIGTVALTLLYPIVFSLSREVLIDFALMAMVALSLDVILASNAGLRTRRAWLLGVVVGCAMLTKWTAVTFLIGPALLWLAISIRRDRTPVKKVLISLGIAAGAFALVALPWYITAFGEFFRRATVALGADPVMEGDPTRILDSLRWYWGAVRDQLIMDLLLIPTLAGLVMFVVRFRSWAGLMFLVCWIVPPLVFFVLIPNKDGRFLVPALPAVAMMAAAGIRLFPWRALRIAVWLFVLTAGVYQFYAISFGWPQKIHHFYGQPPQRPDWKVDEILSALAFPGSDGPFGVVAFLPNDPDFEPNIFMLAVAVRELPIRIETVGFQREPIHAWNRYDAIISKTGSIAVAHAVEFRSKLRDDLQVWVRDSNRDPEITLWRTWPLPDGSRAEVYVIRR